jgi:protein-disulfide isomerase
MNKFTIIMAAVVIGFIAVIFMVREDTDRVEADPSSHIVGEGTSGVTLIEYGDFQCPACGDYYPLINMVKSVYGDEISFQFRHYSLFGSFPNSMAAHLAAEAAGNQDKFFEMHDLLYERQRTWSESNNPREVFEGYAEELELDMEQFREDYGDPRTRAVVMADLQRGNDQGVTGTPTFFINEERIDNPTSVEDFFAIIDEYIERETGEPSQNSPFSEDGEFDESVFDEEQPEMPPGFDVDESIEGAPRTEEEQ